MHKKAVALVTGANQGIGLQIAKELSEKSFTVLVGSRNLARGEEAARTIEGDARALVAGSPSVSDSEDRRASAPEERLIAEGLPSSSCAPTPTPVRALALWHALARV